MTEGQILAVDLKEKVNSVGTQTKFAELMGLSRIYIGQILNRQRPVPFELALRSAKMFGEVDVEFDGAIYEIRIKRDGDDLERELAVADDVDEGPSPVEGALTVTKEMRDVTRHMESIVDHVRCIRQGRPDGKRFLALAVKEVVESQFASEKFTRAVMVNHPDVYKEGLALAMEEIARMYGSEETDGKEDTTTSVA